MAGNRAVSKVTMQELKLRRLVENNFRLRDELSRPRTMVSLASLK
jgi:guanine nucleotide-binding protein subunit gamma